MAFKMNGWSAFTKGDKKHSKTPPPKATDYQTREEYDAAKEKYLSTFKKQTDKKEGKLWTKKQLEKMGKNIKDYKVRGFIGKDDLYQHKDSLSTKHKDIGWDAPKQSYPKHKDTGFDLKSK